MICSKDIEEIYVGMAGEGAGPTSRKAIRYQTANRDVAPAPSPAICCNSRKTFVTGYQYIFVIMLVLVIVIEAAQAAQPARTDSTTTRSMPQDKMNALFGRIHERAAKVPGMRAEFTQRRRMKAFIDDLTSTGTFYFTAPAKFRWEVREPYRSFLIMNGDKVGRFEMVDGKMRAAGLGDRDAVREMLRPMTAMMRGDFAGAEKQFALSGESAPARFAVRLEPRNPKMREFIERITIAIERESLKVGRIQIQEPGGDTIEILFFNQLDAPLNPKLFDVDAPSIEKQK